MRHPIQRILIQFCIFLLPTSVARAQEFEYERVLFPIVIHRDVSLPGLAGSQWETTVSVINRSTEPIKLTLGYGCFDCRGPKPLLPGVTYNALPEENAFGSFLAIERGKADLIDFGLRVRDRTRASTNLGSEIPVVRERDFRSDAFNLLSVPTNADYRLTMRVYALERANEAAFTVRIYSQETFFALIPGFEPYTNSDELLAEATYRLRTPAPMTVFASNFPDYAVISELPNANNLPPLVRVEVIAPMGIKLWGFITLTNNDNHGVTVISPQ